MNSLAWNAWLAFAPTPPSGTAPNPTGQLIQLVGSFAIIGLMFYFVLIRPQQKKAREQATLLQALKPGDKVLTASGIVGVVVGVKDKTLSIRSADSKLEVLKSAVTEITDRASSAPAS